MLTAGFDKRLRLFQVRSLCVCVLSSHSDEAHLLIITQVDGVENKKIQSVFFADMPIRTARFTGDGSQVQQPTGTNSSPGQQRLLAHRLLCLDEGLSSTPLTSPVAA